MNPYFIVTILFFDGPVEVHCYYPNENIYS